MIGHVRTSPVLIHNHPISKGWVMAGLYTLSIATLITLPSWVWLGNTTQPNDVQSLVVPVTLFVGAVVAVWKISEGVTKTLSRIDSRLTNLEHKVGQLKCSARDPLTCPLEKNEDEL
jgi:hypothetical protein